MGSFDFEYWRHLAESDPKAYFQLRERTLRSFIAQHPDQASTLSELQESIDAARVLAGTPVQACRDIMGQVGDHLSLLSVQLADLQREIASIKSFVASRPWPR
ncbi:DUF3135 domain-containing protein [Zoogloea dura]|uniref:DUF3135 domain-containing protein n=1 Tax=Zoogloea dura TaxID=2728840 RepID=A0A848GC22_9RHOO|nr:DUF3135 domain-containing protein [Zoogloea dura]NML28296.1 DUF3135 domain-containing protein [Zoogloea dura]